MNRYWLAGCVVLLSQLLSVAYGKTHPGFPENSAVEIVAENMLINGLPTTAWTLQTGLSQQELAAFYRQQWQAGSDHFDEQELAGDVIINSVHKPYVYTARIHSSTFAATTALIAVSSLETNARLSRSQLLPALAGNRVLSVTEHNEPIGYARTQVLHSRNSLSFNYDFYLQHFQRSGWHAEFAVLDPTEGVAILLLNSARQQISMTFDQQAEGVMIVANEIWGKR